mgnify:CR=1 FL=1
MRMLRMYLFLNFVFLGLAVFIISILAVEAQVTRFALELLLGLLHLRLSLGLLLLFRGGQNREDLRVMFFLFFSWGDTLRIVLPRGRTIVLPWSETLVLSWRRVQRR